MSLIVIVYEIDHKVLIVDNTMGLFLIKERGKKSFVNFGLNYYL